MQRSYEVGRSCEAWCTRCKSEAEHTIVALVDGFPKRVECNICHSQHNYRVAPGQRPPAKKKGSRPRRVNHNNSPGERLLATYDNPGARLYSMTERFEADEVVSHERFGIGVDSRSNRETRLKSSSSRARNFWSTDAEATKAWKQAPGH